MSVQAITWALEQTVGSPTGKVILLCLANYADKNGACFPGHKTIADECEVSVRSVAEWMAKLEGLGLIERTRRFRNNGSRTSDSIILRLPWLPTTTSSEPDANSARGVEPVENPASPHADDRVHHVQQVHPLNRQKNLSPPNPPQAGGAGFAELVKKWPSDHHGNLDNAGGAFRKLALAEQAVAVRAAELTVTAYSRRKSRIPALAAYIRSRVFLDFDGGPGVDPEGHFIITPDRPEWSEWLGWIRREYGERAVQQTVMRKFFLPLTRWPKERVAA